MGSEVQLPATAGTGDLQSPNSGARRGQLARSLLSGAGALGSALAIERGLSFLANLLAARFGGARVFGAYSIAINSANNIASYAGAGIGNTAARFVSEHAPGTQSYRQILRTLGFVSVSSALVAACGLWLGAGPMARLLLRNASLIGPLRVAALSAAAIVLMECCRGVLIGTRNARLLFALSILAGSGLFVLIPVGAHFGPTYMLAGQATAVLLAVAVTASMIRRPNINSATPEAREVKTPSAASVWKFGLVQLLVVVGLNAASWWTAALVARADPSLSQTAFYSVASQLRNLGALLPTLIPQGNFSFFTDEGSAHFGGAERVVTVSTIMASILAILSSLFALVLLPVILRFYGSAYAGAELAAGIAISTILVHLGTAPAAMRLLVTSSRWTACINGLWSIVVVALGTSVIPLGGAVAATAVIFGAHALSMTLIVVALWQLRTLPKGLVEITILDVAAGLVFVGLIWMRATARISLLVLDLTLIAVAVLATLWLLRFGQRCGVLPRPSAIATRLWGTVNAALRRIS